MKSHSQHGKKALGTENNKTSKNSQNIKDIVIFGMLTAILVAAQLGLSWLPNVELVTTLLIIYAQILGKKALVPLYAFVLIEGLIFGFHIWWISYLYVWLVPVFFAFAFKSMDSSIFISVFAAIFGLIFGTLTSIPYLFIGGFKLFVSTLVAGLYFDLSHCIGNLVVSLVLYKPLRSIFSMLIKRFYKNNISNL